MNRLKTDTGLTARRSLGTKLKDSVEGYLFIAPAVVLLGLFGIFPVFFTIYISMHKWRIRRGRFLGLDNFREVIGSALPFLLLVIALVTIALGLRFLRKSLPRAAYGARAVFRVFAALLLVAGIVGVVYFLPQIWAGGDDDMLKSLQVTIWYSLGVVPVQLVLGLFLAVLLDQKFKGKQVFRVIYLLPYIVPSVAAATIFERLFSLRSESLANQFLLLFGSQPLEWLRETRGIFTMLFGWGTASAGTTVGAYWQTWFQGPSLALVTIMFFNYWVFVGYYALIFANGLANIPRQLYEAAEVDGAGKPTVFFRIVLPLLSPATYFLTLLGVIGTFKAFNHIYVLRNAAARGAADPMSIYIFFTFFRKSRFGYAAALSLFLFAVVLVLTVVQRRIMEKRVFYGD